MFHVKPEPTEARLPPQGSQNQQAPSSSQPVKSEGGGPVSNLLNYFTSRYSQSSQPKPPKEEPVPEPVPPPVNENEDVVFGGTFQRPPPPKHNIYSGASDIEYTPEAALKEALNMVETVEDSVKTLILGNMRKDVWDRELESLKRQSSPTTLIAVCGATGAGKSSILNAILDDNIVPTSGMRACTAVVTEIAYHNNKAIHGDVSFLSEGEWRQELGVLLHDLVDEDGSVKRTTDLKSDAGIAWSKVHAVYPRVEIDRLVKMSVDEILSLDHTVSNILGTTKHIKSPDSKAFGKEIAKYIDSKDQKRGDKKDKKDKEKSKEKSLMDKVRAAAGQQSAKRDVPKGDEPALWPLIRQVTVRCPAKALSTGAILVDLPGVADANAARNNIAKDYMKKANCIWILAPITRAVDDKTARDLLGDAFKMQLKNGNYDDHCITFIASKCDDISCSEVISALDLRDDPELERIEEKIESIADEIAEQKKKKSDSEKEFKKLQEDLRELRERTEDWRAHLEALEAGESYVSKFAAKAKSSSPSGKKRKNTRKGKGGSSKKRRSVASDEESDDDISIVSSDSDSDESDNDSDADSDNSDAEEKSEVDSADEVADDLVEEETEETLKDKLENGKQAIKALKASQKEAKEAKKEASDRLSVLEKQRAKAQKEKNAFCSLKRSEFSRDVLKNDFRTGLQDLDNSEAEKNDPENFDPSKKLRDYDKIDLPVFTVSSRDYVRLKGQVKGDGGATCFSNVEDTGIPAVQEWCHKLTIASRERAARGYLQHIATFARTVQTYVQGIGDVTAMDREMLREKWESQGFVDQAPQEAEDPWAQFLQLDQDVVSRINGANKPAPKEKRDAQGRHIGITPRLCHEFSELVDKCVEDLKQRFKDGLEDKCRQGAAEASSRAVPLHDEFAGSMHWGTYRATLRRHGCWRRDLNMELINPFTKAIAVSWGAMFESDLFGPFEKAITKAVTNLLAEFETSAAPGLKDRVKLQGEACLEEARQTVQQMIAAVQETMANQQKEISRSMSPHVQAEMIYGYDRAMEERGTGSVARQKSVMRNYISDNKDDIFDGGADVILNRLDEAAEAVSAALDKSLESLAQKVEVNLSVLWEGLREDPAQVRARKHVVDVVAEVQKQLAFWQTAAQLKKDNQHDDDEDVVMDDAN